MEENLQKRGDPFQTKNQGKRGFGTWPVFSVKTDHTIIKEKRSFHS